MKTEAPASEATSIDSYSNDQVVGEPEPEFEVIARSEVPDTVSLRKNRFSVTVLWGGSHVGGALGHSYSIDRHFRLASEISYLQRDYPMTEIREKHIMPSARLLGYLFTDSKAQLFAGPGIAYDRWERQDTRTKAFEEYSSLVPQGVIGLELRVGKPFSIIVERSWVHYDNDTPLSAEGVVTEDRDRQIDRVYFRALF